MVKRRMISTASVINRSMRSAASTWGDTRRGKGLRNTKPGIRGGSTSPRLLQKIQNRSVSVLPAFAYRQSVKGIFPTITLPKYLYTCNITYLRFCGFRYLSPLTPVFLPRDGMLAR